MKKVLQMIVAFFASTLMVKASAKSDINERVLKLRKTMMEQQMIQAKQSKASNTIMEYFTQRIEDLQKSGKSLQAQ